MPFSKMNPAPYNPRVRFEAGDEEYESLKKSIQSFGTVEPIVWNRKTGNVIGGHRRMQILLDMGQKETDVSVVDLPLTEEQALNLALNRIGGQWDMEKLPGLLKELDEAGWSEFTGFSEQELDNMLSELEAHSYIDDLLTDEFVQRSNAARYFSVTFTFEIADKESIDRYLKENGKEPIVEKILEMAREEL